MKKFISCALVSIMLPSIGATCFTVPLGDDKLSEENHVQSESRQTTNNGIPVREMASIKRIRSVLDKYLKYWVKWNTHYRNYKKFVENQEFDNIEEISNKIFTTVNSIEKTVEKLGPSVCEFYFPEIEYATIRLVFENMHTIFDSDSASSIQKIIDSHVLGTLSEEDFAIALEKVNFCCSQFHEFCYMLCLLQNTVCGKLR